MAVAYLSIENYLNKAINIIVRHLITRNIIEFIGVSDLDPRSYIIKEIWIIDKKEAEVPYYYLSRA